ncbi:alpha-L-fucosidase [Lederbergia citrisecunda]|uniref:alpha-L-fucosidase n=1 Tax=Lederbergia citrisecunda TaxID=2833583 RepID=UPI0032E7FDE3
MNKRFKFKTENFRAEEGAELFKQSGARYIMLVAEHHDGFQLYKSEISSFKVYEMGTKRDLFGVAFEEQGLELTVSSHRAEHWFFM